ncbi:MAG: hypothetical protein D6768_06700 [Chloroflexi bacterium]|nr:MAG: hypothetical protein D6768_06700 [Chloroflexota bacterium]
MNRLLIWGAGELGGRVGRLWAQAGGRTLGFTRSSHRHPALQGWGIEPHTGSPAAHLRPGDHLLLALPGHRAQQQAVQHLIAAQVEPPARAVFISVTAIYGDTAGSLREETPPGSDDRSSAIAAAEQTFRDWAGTQGVILRLGGLYCNGRGPFSALARRGSVTRQAPPNKTMALLHYEDAAAAVVAALNHPAPEAVYLAVTPPCPTRQEFYRAACAKLGLPEPAYAPPLDTPPVQFDVTRLRRDLLPVPNYPDWRAALVFSNHFTNS